MDGLTTGQRMRQAREARGLSRPKLSKMSGIGCTSIEGYESDRNDPSLFAATCIADVLGISLDWLAGRTKRHKKEGEK